jgi:hypothetical protein
VPIGDQHVELLCADLDSQHPWAVWQRAQTVHGDRLLAWAIESEDPEAEADRTDLEWVEHRGTFGGVALSWRFAGVADAFAEPGHPFFVAWDDPAAYRAVRDERVAAAGHRVDALEIAWVEVSGDERSIRDRIGPRGAPVRHVPGAPAVRAAGIALAGGGEIELRVEALSAGR